MCSPPSCTRAKNSRWAFTGPHACLAAQVTLPSAVAFEQCEKAADRCPQQEPVPEEAGAAADQRHGGVHVRAHLPAGRVRHQAGGAWEPSVRPGR